MEQRDIDVRYGTGLHASASLRTSTLPGLRCDVTLHAGTEAVGSLSLTCWPTCSHHAQLSIADASTRERDALDTLTAARIDAALAHPQITSVMAWHSLADGCDPRSVPYSTGGGTQ